MGVWEDRFTLTETAVAINVLVLAAICVRYRFIQCLAISGDGPMVELPVLVDMVDGFESELKWSSWSTAGPFT
jgi:hypothetical protein